MGPIGMQEMIFVIILALLLFGPKKLPELARLLGKGMTEFRRAKSELKSTFDTHLQELERETRMEESRKNPPATTTYSPYSYVTDEHGNTPDYANSGHLGSSTPYPSEPPVEAHSNGVAPAPVVASLPPAPAVPGTIPRSSAVPPEPAKDEHPA